MLCTSLDLANISGICIILSWGTLFRAKIYMSLSRYDSVFRRSFSSSFELHAWKQPQMSLRQDLTLSLEIAPVSFSFSSVDLRYLVWIQVLWLFSWSVFGWRLWAWIVESDHAFAEIGSFGIPDFVVLNLVSWVCQLDRDFLFESWKIIHK